MPNDDEACKVWFICKFCGRAYMHRERLNEHKLEVHLQLLLQIKRDKLNTLSAAVKVSKTTPKQVKAQKAGKCLGSHMLDEGTKAKEWRCKGSLTLTDLAKGIGRRSRKRGQCWVCVNEPKAVRELCTHDSRTLRPFPCIQCGKTYSSDAALQKHSKLHFKMVHSDEDSTEK